MKVRLKLLILPQRNIRYEGLDIANCSAFTIAFVLLCSFRMVSGSLFFEDMSLWELVFVFLQVVYRDGDVEILLLKNEQYELIEGDAMEDEVRRHTDFALFVNCHVPCMLESQDSSKLIITFKYNKNQP